MNISVCMATFNGEKYLKKQLDSIISQLNLGDELIISDDGSTDNTIKILKTYEEKIKKIEIKILNGPQKGVVKNFEFLLKQAKKDLVFLADQDDVWNVNKVAEVKKIFLKNPEVTLVIHEAALIDENDFILGSKAKYKKGILKNILRNSYIGCCMVLKNNNNLTPFPIDIPMHDSWLGILNEKIGKVYHLDKKIFSYRIHKENYTIKNKRKCLKKIKDRMSLIKNIFQIKGIKND